MRKYQLIILTCVVFTACASLGTSTVYKTKEKISLHSFGFAILNIDSLHGTIPKNYFFTKTTFNTIVPSTFKELGFDSVMLCNLLVDFDKPDTNAISEYCTKQNLDGLIISQLRFGFYQQQVGLVNYAASSSLPLDTYVTMKLYSKVGKLLITISHNTHYGNSYFNIPSQDTMVKDGTKGAVQRMGTEIKTIM